jgi:hypothetical protein
MEILEEEFKNNMDFSLKNFFLKGVNSRKIEEKNSLIILTYQYSFTEKMGRFDVLNSGTTIKAFSKEDVGLMSFKHLLKSKYAGLLKIPSENTKPCFGWQYDKKGELNGLEVQIIL